MNRPRRSHAIESKQKKTLDKQDPNLYYTQSEITENDGECRICLEGQSLNNKLITPCKCIGSVKYIHYECMKQWITKNLQKKQLVIKCQLCHEPIVYQIKNHKECNSWSTIKMKVQINYKIFIFLLFLFLLNCGVTIYLIAVFAHVMQQSAQQPKFIEIGVISFSIVLLLVITGIILGILIRQFSFSQSRRIGQILNYVSHEKKISHVTLNESKFNMSKAKIHPMTMTQIEQLQ